MTSLDSHAAPHGYHDENTREALEIIPTGLFLLTAAHDGQDNWQFVQRGLGITAGPPTIVLVVLSRSRHAGCGPRAPASRQMNRRRRKHR